MIVPRRIASLTQLLVGFSQGEAEDAATFCALFSKIPQSRRFALARIGSGLGLGRRVFLNEDALFKLGSFEDWTVLNLDEIACLGDDAKMTNSCLES